MTTKLTKANFKDLRDQADAKLDGYMFDVDMEEGYLYVDCWEKGEQVVLKYPYTWSDGILLVDKDAGTPVVRSTTYKDVPVSIEKRLGRLEGLFSHFSGSKQEAPDDVTGDLIKKFDPDKMEILEPAYIAGNEVDAHGDAYEDPVKGPDDLVKAIKEGIAANTLQYSIGHVHKTHTFEIIKAWVNKEELTLDNGTVIPPNQPVVITKFHNEEAYNDRVEGRLTGLSMGALGTAKLIKSLQDQMKLSAKPERLLSDFILTHKAAHFAYTLPVQGGAASLKDEPYMIIKSNTQPLAVLDEMLKRYGEEFTELDKAKFLSNLVDKTAPSTSAEVEALDAGVDNKTVNKGQKNMSDVDTQNTELKEALKLITAMKIEKSLAKYGLDAETSENLSTSLADLKDTSAVVKAMDDLLAASEAKVSALESEKEELAKSVATTPLEKGMNEEVGTADAQERSEPTEEEIRKANRELAKKEIK